MSILTMIKKRRRCIPISVLMIFRRHSLFSKKTADFVFPFSLAAVFIKFWFTYINIIKLTCGKFHKNPSRQKNKDRYRSASLTVEAAFAFPVFFFAVLYLIQMFVVLQAELKIADAGIASAREAAAFSYAAERMADGENAVAEKLFSLFDKKIVRDGAFTALFYGRCDKELLKLAGVAQGLGGIWVDTSKDGATVELDINYRVKPENALFPRKQGYYQLHLVYRNWTGEGERVEKKREDSGEIVYLADNATVYHLDKNCTYINIKVSAVQSGVIEEKRNAAGAKYYPCEFCEPVLRSNEAVYVTMYGTRYHALSSCSAIKRSPRECPLKEVENEYRVCRKCEKKQEEEKEGER